MPTKLKLGLWLSGSFAVLLLLAAVHWVQAEPQDPLYQGKRLSMWLNDLGPGSSGVQRDKAREAVWTLGTNTLAPLPNMLRARDWIPRHVLIGLNQFGANRSPLRFHIRTAAEKHIRALTAYGLLGPLASPDVPLLSRMLCKERSPEVRVQSARALHCIKPVGREAAVAVASLTEATRDIDPEVRSCSVLALLVISPNRELLVPVLVERLGDPSAPTRELAQSGLLGIGDAAIAALRDSRQTNQIADQILKEMHERKLHPAQKYN